DPEIYAQPVESLRFGYSILLFGAMGYLMQGIQPLFKQGKWHFSAILSGIAIFLYLTAEYAIITFIRGDAVLTEATLRQMTYSSLLTMLMSPLIFWLLFRVAKPADTRSTLKQIANAAAFPNNSWNLATDSGFTC
ncbi:MAG: hypothetical protein HC767_15415, partial [Akkermansiaceae bacterium]|nr:hypothetical protein [Akkermansiaceae bacterium]